MRRILTIAIVVVVTIAAHIAAASASSASSQVRIEKTLKLQPGGTFVLDADAGSVRITGDSPSGVRVRISSKNADIEKRFDFRFEQEAGRVRVVAKRKGLLSSWFSWSSDSLEFDVAVPSSAALQVATGGGHLEILSIKRDSVLRTSGGHIEVNGLTGLLQATTSGGHIQITDIRGSAVIKTSGGHIEASAVDGSLEARTSGGHITLRKVTGDITAGTSGGHIEIQGAGGRISAETSGGRIEAVFAGGNAQGGTLESSGGGVEVRVDPRVNLTVDAEASGGSVTSDLPIAARGTGSRSSLRGSLGKGGRTLTIRASGGSIGVDSL